MKKVNIHPNPSTGIFQISVDQAVNVKVVNAMGQTIFSGMFDGSFNLDLSDQSQGVCFLSIESEKINQT